MTAKASSWLFRKWLLALILAIGTAGIWLTVVTWLLTTVVVPNSGNYDTLVYSGDGDPFVQSYNIRNYQTRSYRGLDGKKLEMEEQTWLTAGTASGDPMEYWAPPTQAWTGRIAALSDGRAPATYWYFLRNGNEHESAYFVGYDSVSKRQIGYLDAAGFHADAPRQPFASATPNANHWISGIASSQGIYAYGAVHEPVYYTQTSSKGFPGWRVYLIDGDRLLEVDLRQRDQAPRVLFEHKDMLSVQIHGGFQLGVTPTPTVVAAEPSFQREALIVSTINEVIVYDPMAQQPVSYQRPRELVGKTVTVYRPASGGLLMEGSEFKAEGSYLTTIYTFAADGTLANTNEVTLTRGEAPSPQVAAIGFSIAAPVPLLAAFTMAAMPLSKMQFDPELAYGDAFLQSLLEMGIYPLVAILISAALAWLCYRRQRRFADPVIVPWIVLIMLLGAPGYLGYRLSRRWPVRLTCPACRMLSPSNRPQCIDCGADWPRSDVKGIEVFA